MSEHQMNSLMEQLEKLKYKFNSPLFKEQVLKLNKNKPVVVFCHAGGRSAKASLMLDSLGFKEVYDLRGGYSSWK